MKTLLILFTFVCMVLFSVKKNEVTFLFEINYRNHTNIFNYLKNVDNFPVLNPTIYRIELVEGNEEEFEIVYHERLSHFPGITNIGRAHYKVLKDDENGPHELHSTHSTCFIGGYFCLPTIAKVLVTATERSRTSYEEIIMYDCPWIMTVLCLNEVSFQRLTIMKGLESVFGGKS